jgi:Tfp pilus assembly protein PilF
MHRFGAMKPVFCLLLNLSLLFGLSGCRSHPNSADTQPHLQKTDLLKVAEAHFHQRKMNTAEEELRAVLNGDPRNNEAHYYLNLIQEFRTKQRLNRERDGLWYPTLPPREVE